MPEDWARRALRILVTPVGLALLSAVRLLIISNYNVTTAVTVAESGGYVNTFLGSLIPLVPVFMPYLALVFLAFRRFVLCALTVVATALISPVVPSPSIILGYFYNNWMSTFRWIGGQVYDATSVISFVILVVMLFIAWLYLRGSWVHGLVSALWLFATLLVLAPYLFLAYPAPSTESFYASYLRQPWLTAEQITVDPGEIYQGYVLSSDDQWMTVLLYQSRTIAYFRADSVTARVVCESPAKPPPSPLIRLLNVKSPALPECRNSDSWAVAQHGASSAATKMRSNSTKTAAPIPGAEGKVVPPLRHGSQKVPPRRPHKIARQPAPPKRFDHRHRMPTARHRNKHTAGASPRPLQPGHTEVLSGELFLLLAAYRDKSFGKLA
jgi:hypothetical protein